MVSSALWQPRRNLITAHPMELNISSVQKPPSAKPSFSANKVSASSKGNWKKRRTKAVKTRLQIEQKHGLNPKGKVNKITDEFASGIADEEKQEKPDTAEVNENGKRSGKSKTKNDSKQPPKRQRTNPILGAGQNFKLMGEKGAETEEAIGATLEIVGGKLADKHLKKLESASGSEEMVEKEIGGTVENEAAADKKDETEGDQGFGPGDFESVGLYASVARHLKFRMEMEKPTNIQERVIKSMLNIPNDALACDVLVRSATGSGKTLAYLLPIAHYLLNRRKRVAREEGSFAIVLVPTRELAEQVESVAATVLKPWHWIVVGSVRGGEPKNKEKARLRKGVSVLVATPGRLLDHIRNTNAFRYGRCEFLVLDEADRLLDLGFEADIKEIIDNLNRHMVTRHGMTIRSNIMLSATMRSDVERLARFSLKEPIQISVEEDKGDDNKFKMPSQLKQHLCVVEQRHRLVTLAAFLRLRAMRGVPRKTGADKKSLPGCKIMVFFSTCDSVDFHYQILQQTKLPEKLRMRATAKSDSEEEKLIPVPVYRLHGNMDQAARVQSLRSFRNCRRGVLLCTDVAARGLDLAGVEFSMQYDPPTGGQGEELEYVHRAGRTARMGKRGDALLFLLPSERAYQGKLEKAGVAIREISNNTALAALLPGTQLDVAERVAYAARLVTSELQSALEETVTNDSTLKEMAYAGYLAYCRAYATHAKDVKHYFHVRNLHLGHVARAFALTEKPANLGSLLEEMKVKKAAREEALKKEKGKKTTGNKGSIARAIAEGEQQPFNDQSTALAKRRRERGIGGETQRELASEFAS